MKKNYFTCTLILFLGLSFNAQIDFNNPPWKTGCESDPDANQMEMNECSYIQYHIADSILNSQYDFLIDKQQKFYDKEKKLFEHENDNFRLKLLKQIENQINSLKESKADFITFRTSSCDVVGYQYEGGSMAPLAINYHALKLTVNQIRVLEEFKTP